MPSEPFPRARNLDLSAPEGAGPPGAGDAAARAEGAQAVVVDSAVLPDAPPPAPAASKPPPPQSGVELTLPRVAWADLARARSGDEACLDEDDNRAGGAVPVRCPSAPLAAADAQAQAALCARRGDAVLLDGLDRWYRLGPAAAGFCQHCERALNQALQMSYGPQVEPFAVLHAERGTGVPLAQRPYAGLREALRLEQPLLFAKAAVLRARDEARKLRQLELPVLARVGPLSALSLLLCRHLDGLVFSLPSLDPHDALLPLLAARTALGERAAVAQLSPQARPDQVRLFAALASACGCDLMLQPGASQESRAELAAHRRYAALLRERYRPSASLSDVDLIVAPRADHWSHGQHLKASTQVAAALQRAQLQVGVRLDEPAPSARGGAKVLALCGASAIPDSLAGPLRRHVETGGDLLLCGQSIRIDDEGRPIGPLFPEAKSGLERVAEGRVYAVALEESAPSAAALEPLLQKALRELLGRTQKAITMQGRGALLARAYLDPERKLDVHLVNLDLRDGAGFGAAQGVLLQIAGAAAGGGRTGYWFSPDRGGKDGERITLNPSGFSVSTVLPSVGACALLSVPR